MILGGTSDIAGAVARAFVADGWSIQLAGRDEAALRRQAGRIAASGTTAVTVHRLDILDLDGIAAFVAAVDPLPDVVVSAVGLMGGDDPADAAAVRATIDTNLTGPAIALAHFARRFRDRGSGILVGISSVAGDRGRARTMTYGAAKAGFTAFLSALRQSCHGTGVHVITVKPGFVRTRMTAGLDLPAALVTTPDRVAADIRRAVARRSPVVVTPFVWRPAMALVRALPEFLFRRMRF
jgi:short-subunit dehydrogenase